MPYKVPIIHVVMDAERARDPLWFKRDAGAAPLTVTPDRRDLPDLEVRPGDVVIMGQPYSRGELEFVEIYPIDEPVRTLAGGVKAQVSFPPIWRPVYKAYVLTLLHHVTTEDFSTAVLYPVSSLHGFISQRTQLYSCAQYKYGFLPKVNEVLNGLYLAVSFREQGKLWDVLTESRAQGLEERARLIAKHKLDVRTATLEQLEAWRSTSFKPPEEPAPADEDFQQWFDRTVERGDATRPKYSLYVAALLDDQVTEVKGRVVFPLASTWSVQHQQVMLKQTAKRYNCDLATERLDDKHLLLTLTVKPKDVEEAEFRRKHLTDDLKRKIVT